jgi:surfactin synthase thioesterase subunit
VSGYRALAEQLHPDIEVVGIRLAGREQRFCEPLCYSLRSILDDLIPELIDDMTATSMWAFFGHSMGALLAFETCRELRRRGRTLPHHLFVSGRQAPQCPNERGVLHTLPPDELVKELRGFNGTPPETFVDDDLLALVLPVMVADLTLCETHQHADEPPLDIAVTAIGGTADPDLSPLKLEAWRFHTTRIFHPCWFAGDHFYIHQHVRELAELIRRAPFHTASA